MSSRGPTAPQAVAETLPTEDLVGSSAAGPAALRGSALRSFGYAATVLLSIVSAPLLIRHLGIAAFGRYTTVVAVVTIVGGLTDGGLLSIAVREWATHRGKERDELLKGLLGLRLTLTAGGVLGGVAFALVARYPNDMVVGALVAGIGMGLQVIANLMTVALQGDLRFGWATVIDISRQAVATVLIIVLVLVGAGLVPLMAAMVPAGLTALTMTAMLVRGHMPLSPRLRVAAHWPLIRETLPYAAAIAVNTLYFRVTIVAMSLIAPARQTGYFATSFRVTEVLVGIPTLAVGTVFPVLARAAHDDRARLRYATERVMELALLAGAGLAVMVVLIAPFAVQVLAGNEGSPAAPVLQIQGLALAATFPSAATGYVLLSLRRHSALLTANSAALIANVVLTLILVPLAQAQGAAIAAVVAESCLAIGQTTLLVTAGQFRVHVVSLLTTAAACGAGVLPLFVPGLAPLLRTVIGACLFVAMLGIFRRIPPELRHLMPVRRTH